MSAIPPNPATAGRSEHNLESLCEEYCPPLEAGLVYALASDFDLDNRISLQALRRTLDEIKDSAVVEQDLELLPQTTDSCGFEKLRNSSVDKENKLEDSNLSSEPSRSDPRSTTDEDAITSVTTGLSGLKSSDADDSDFEHVAGYGEAGVDFKNLSDDGKCSHLANMFPNVKVQDIKDVLVRCGGSFDRSTDELLNISFIRESKEEPGDQAYMVPRGIDGFLHNNAGESPRKVRGKGRRIKNRTDHKDLSDAWNSDSAMSSGATTPNLWKDLSPDVEFIASRTYLRTKIITSTYHANGEHLPPTIRALAIKEGELYAKSPNKVDEIIEWQMDELRVEFRQIPDPQIYGALMLANKIPSAAKELLDAMSISNEKPVLLGKVTGLASYTPINLSDDEGRSKKQSGSTWISEPASGGVYTVSHLGNDHGQAATQAFHQASAAYRRGKSDHLMGGAAAYYASVGHEKIKAAKSIQAAAADAHVAAQSSHSTLDLHGVNVADAVRIAQRATAGWWEALGDRKYVVGGKGDGYRIVTGVGKHSADGIGRIGPAVSKMLVREGWKVEVGRGEIIVSGRARR